MNIWFSVLVAMGLSMTALATEKATTCVYEVKGMTCASCEATLKVGVKKLEGIKSVKASSETSKAAVSFDTRKTNSKMIKAAINKIGYEAKLKYCQEDEVSWLN